jgi:hypothetical protein
MNVGSGTGVGIVVAGETVAAAVAVVEDPLRTLRIDSGRSSMVRLVEGIP